MSWKFWALRGADFSSCSSTTKNVPINSQFRIKETPKPERYPRSLKITFSENSRSKRTMIENHDIPLRHYNYRYIRDLLRETHHQKAALSTIIERAKKHGFYLKRKRKKAPHDREVLTNYIGELIQHDFSHHLWSPPAREKWYLITSLDDFSRFLLYAALVTKETSWTHIGALQTVVLTYGAPFLSSVDSHSIFRFVQGRDSLWRCLLSPPWQE